MIFFFFKIPNGLIYSLLLFFLLHEFCGEIFLYCVPAEITLFVCAQWVNAFRPCIFQICVRFFKYFFLQIKKANFRKNFIVFGHSEFVYCSEFGVSQNQHRNQNSKIIKINLLSLADKFCRQKRIMPRYACFILRSN